MAHCLINKLIFCLERLQKEWRSPIYAFFHPNPEITYIDNRRAHDFTCNAKDCKGWGKNPCLVRRYLDTRDSKSTGGLRRHAKICWGEENLERADAAKNIEEARKILKNTKLIDGKITAVFERTGQGKVTYSNRQHTRSETRYGSNAFWSRFLKKKTRAEIVKWVSESLRPFSIVEDEGFKMLMKTGRPEYYIPSRITVARDVRHVFKKTRERIAQMLKVNFSIIKFD